ncbi:hypothetical protein C0995_010434 [Termitomyces sp. Mi166|nr:hypothetical protein C0995_010434 [Termitomyces sp. Mi166\
MTMCNTILTHIKLTAIPHLLELPDNICTPLQPQQIQLIIRQADKLSQYGCDREDKWKLSLGERDENQIKDNLTMDLPETQEDGLEEGKDGNLSGEGEVEDTAWPPQLFQRRC